MIVQGLGSVSGSCSGLGAFPDWCFGSNSGLISWFKFRFGVLVQIQDWCLGSNSGLVPWFKFRFGVLVQIQVWCLGSNLGLVQG